MITRPGTKIDFWNIWWFYLLGNESEILDSKFEDDKMTRLLVFEQTKKNNKKTTTKNEVRAYKKAPRPKITILKSGSVFRSPWGPTFQISLSYDLKPPRLEWTDKETKRQRDKQTMQIIM